MAGNEIEISKFIFNNLNKIKLSHLGQIKEIGAPLNLGGFSKISSLKELDLIATQNSGKKADIYLNGRGVSLKQSGANFPFNRLQRADLLAVFMSLGFNNPEENLKQIDDEVHKFHIGEIKQRSRPWNALFSETDFKKLVKFLMTEGSPNLGLSNHPAEFILEAPKKITNANDLKVYTFEEYFSIFNQKIFFAIRRQWIGQSSDSEHKRALGLSKKEGNKKWVYNNIAGSPKVSKNKGTIWRNDVQEKDRRTVYLIFVEKV